MTCPEDPTHPMGGKTVLVTGANSGIGYHTALELARAGARVLLHARREEAGREAVAGIVEATGNEAVDLVLANFASLQQVRALGQEVQERVDHLDVLVNNAGAVLDDRYVTEDGNEQQVQVNHLAPFLLTHELLPALHAAPSSRIVNVASEAHWNVRKEPEALQSLEGRYSSFGVYSRTKLYNVLFTRALDRRLQGTEMTTNALHPGVIGSGFGRQGPFYVRWFMKLAKPLLTDPAKGARTSLHLASSPELQGTSGHYFKACERAEVSKLARDHDLEARLWNESVALTGAKDWRVQAQG